MKKILPVVVAGTMLCFAANGFLSCVTKGQNEGIVDSDSVVDPLEEKVEDTIHIETQKAAKKSKYADVSVLLSLPQGDGVAKSMRQTLDHIIGERMADCMKGISDGSAKMSPYNGGVGSAKAICNYYSQQFFNVLGKMCKDEYDSNVEYIQSDQTITEEERKEQLSYISLEPYAFDEKLTYVGQTDRCITFLLDNYCFFGGAHGSSSGDYITFSKKDGSQVKTMLKKGAAKQMQRLLKDGLKQYFSENGKKMSDRELMDNLQIEGSIIPLPSDGGLALKQDGLLFVYGQYEIACYAAGMPSFILPYEKVKEFMTDEAKALIE